MSESTVFGVGLWMSISRLCVRTSKCSRESLSLNGTADHAVDVLLGGQRHGAGDRRTGALSRLHDLGRRAVHLLVVVALEPDSDLLLRHVVSLPVSVGGGGMRSRPSARRYLTISVTTPAPTVRPPSRIAKRRPWSMAIGWPSSISMFVLSPGMTISWPSGSLIEPVTSVVRK